MNPEKLNDIEEPSLLSERDIEALLDAHALGVGPLRAERIGSGLSNITFRLQREGADLILRRPPRPPLIPGAHDVVGEARILSVLREHGVRVPQVLLVHEDDALLGVPFYVMERVRGYVLTDGAPPEFWVNCSSGPLMDEFLNGLIEIHAVPLEALRFLRRRDVSTFNARKISLWNRILAQCDARSIPELVSVGQWLSEHQPLSRAETLTHGDYRFANLMFSHRPELRLAAVLDWEMAVIGDPLADLAYALAFHPVPGDDEGLLLGAGLFSSHFAADPAWPCRSALLARYERATGRTVHAFDWYLAFAIWRVAVGMESMYQRSLRGKGGAVEESDAFEHEVLLQAHRAAEVTARGMAWFC